MLSTNWPTTSELDVEFTPRKVLRRSGSPRSVDHIWQDETETNPYHKSPSALSHCSTATEGASAAADEIQMRVVSYNIHGWRDTVHKDNFEELVASLRTMNADVVALQEVLHPYRPPSDAEEAEAYFERVKAGKGNGFKGEYLKDSSEKSYLEALAEALGLPHVSFGKAVDDGYFGEFGYGNAIISRFPVVAESHTVVKPDARHQAGRRIEAEDRCFSVVTLQSGPESTHTFCVTHLDQLSDELRLEQVQRMLPLAEAAGPHVLCGDFNVFQRADCSEEQWQAILDDATGKGWSAPPETTAAIQEVLGRGYRDCFYLSDNHVKGSASSSLAVEGMAEDSATPGATCWVVKPLLRIDYTFLSRGLDSALVRQYQRLLHTASDHFPILIDLALPVLESSSSSTTSSRSTTSSPVSCSTDAEN
eukprot:CAMPEP_0181298152 /NCGR_PEP_ID=MMETSP1101-20121128/5630_1 /TAXON_ID=46948 /ORGANISM="Rhodomonas abbreviata, Strain Caron Lab Isolate" /LENGTH=419 /DNA_ID=CAMNT_0023403155 /DNA_START=151 /DNA_END=1410 /DNA_ORIENTATION=-